MHRLARPTSPPVHSTPSSQQYSLDWFIDLFVRAIANSEADADLQKRMDNLNTYFQYFLYRNVCRSLFEKDKLCFSLLLCIALLKGDDKIDGLEWRFLLTGGILLDASTIRTNPAPDLISQQVWESIACLSELPAFKARPALEPGRRHRPRLLAYH